MRHLAWRILLLFSIVATTVSGSEYGIEAGSGKDTVYFRSTARLEFIQGESNDLTGGFVFDVDNPTGPVSGILRVDLRTLKTGIETRDGHMRDRHLHTEEFPFAYFELVEATGLPASFVSDSTFEGAGHGFFYIHGVKRRLTADLKLQMVSGRLEVRAAFQINLDDYGIPRPKALFLKLAETIEVEVIFSGYNSLRSTPVVLPEWPEKD